MGFPISAAIDTMKRPIPARRLMCANVSKLAIDVDSGGVYAQSTNPISLTDLASDIVAGMTMDKTKGKLNI
jgi:hypothetical protein